MKIQVTLLFYKGDLILTAKQLWCQNKYQGKLLVQLARPWRQVTILMHSTESEVVLAPATEQKWEEKKTRPAVLKEAVRCWPTK